jgi:hypothetical protein
MSDGWDFTQQTRHQLQRSMKRKLWKGSSPDRMEELEDTLDLIPELLPMFLKPFAMEVKVMLTIAGLAGLGQRECRGGRKWGGQVSGWEIWIDVVKLWRDTGGELVWSCWSQCGLSTRPAPRGFQQVAARKHAITIRFEFLRPSAPPRTPPSLSLPHIPPHPSSELQW